VEKSLTLQARCLNYAYCGSFHNAFLSGVPLRTFQHLIVLIRGFSGEGVTHGSSNHEESA